LKVRGDEQSVTKLFHARRPAKQMLSPSDERRVGTVLLAPQERMTNWRCRPQSTARRYLFSLGY